MAEKFGFRDFTVIRGAGIPDGYGSLTKINTAGFPLQWRLGCCRGGGLGGRPAEQIARRQADQIAGRCRVR